MNTMKQQQALLQFYLKKARSSLAGKPEGQLTTSISHYRSQFYWKSSQTDGKWIYLPKREKKLLRALAQKEYDMKFIKTAEKLSRNTNWLIGIGSCREIHSFYQILAKVYTNLPAPKRAFVEPYVLPDDLFASRWKEVNYEGKSFAPNTPEIYTDNEERVRSKSEKIIADRLQKLGIPYRYEYPLKIRTAGLVYPDFILLDVWNRREVILEHFGLMQDKEYFANAMKKISAYMQAGYCLGEGLLFTMESDSYPLDMRYFDNMIQKRFPHVFEK